MQKKVLSEQILYYGEIKMPEGFEINPLNLTNNLFKALYTDRKHVESRDFDKLNTYIREHIRIKHDLDINDDFRPKGVEK